MNKENKKNIFLGSLQTLSRRKGFTLVETLVAILILMMSISGPFFVVQQSLISATIARDQTTARFLAQEGIEVLRAVRDSNFLSGNIGPNWLSGFTNCDTSQNPDGCMVDATANRVAQIKDACTGSCSFLNYNEATSLFNHATIAGPNQPSKFIRKVTIREINSGKDAFMEVEVIWSDRGVSRNVKTQSYLFNWI